MLQDKTSLRNMNTKDLKAGSTHLVRTSLPSNVADTVKIASHTIDVYIELVHKDLFFRF